MYTTKASIFKIRLGQMEDIYIKLKQSDINKFQGLWIKTYKSFGKKEVISKYSNREDFKEGAPFKFILQRCVGLVGRDAGRSVNEKGTARIKLQKWKSTEYDGRRIHKPKVGNVWTTRWGKRKITDVQWTPVNIYKTITKVIWGHLRKPWMSGQVLDFSGRHWATISDFWVRNDMLRAHYHIGSSFTIAQKGERQEQW